MVGAFGKSFSQSSPDRSGTTDDPQSSFIYPKISVKQDATPNRDFDLCGLWAFIQWE